MAKAGADIIGANCLFDPWINLETLKKMKAGLDAFNIKPFLMAQPNAYRCPDCGPFGWLSIPEFPYGRKLSTPLPPTQSVLLFGVPDFVDVEQNKVPDNV